MVKRINDGENVATTLVQISEIANILESYMPVKIALGVEEFLLMAGNVKVYDMI
jgi:hypothetical protein